MTRGKARSVQKEPPTKLVGLGSIGCMAVLQCGGLRISPSDIVAIDTAEGRHAAAAAGATLLVVHQDAERPASGLSSGQRYSVLTRVLKDVGAAIVAFSTDDHLSVDAHQIALLAQKSGVPTLAVVAVPTGPKRIHDSATQQRLLEVLYETFDSVLAVEAEVTWRKGSWQRKRAQQRLLRSAIECITRNMLSADIADALLSRTFMGLSMAVGRSSAVAVSDALNAKPDGEQREQSIGSARMLLMLVASASNSHADAAEMLVTAGNLVDPAADLVASSATDEELEEGTRVTIVYLSARSDVLNDSSNSRAATRIAEQPLTLFNIRNDSRLRLKQAALATDRFDDEDDDTEPVPDEAAFRQFVRLHPVGSRFEATIRRFINRGVRVAIEGGYTGDVTLDASSNQVEMTQIGQQLVATVEDIFEGRRALDVHIQRVDQRKPAALPLPGPRRREPFALSDYIVHPVDARRLVRRIQESGRADVATFPLRVSATVPLPGRIDDGFLHFMMEAPPAPLRVRFLHPQFDTHSASQFSVIGLFPSGAIRTVGVLKPAGGVAELHPFSLWHLMDPENAEEGVHRTSARIAVDLVGVLC